VLAFDYGGDQLTKGNTQTGESMAEFDFAPAYKVAGQEGIAWRVTSYAKEDCLVEDYFEDEDGVVSYAEWEEVEDRSRVIAHMIGDDSNWTFDITDLTPLEDDEYCSSCGQVGCGWH
jgi:hypothetical protein